LTELQIPVIRIRDYKSQKAGLKRVLFPSAFFCLDVKEPKGQVEAKLLPHMPNAGPLPLRPIAPIFNNALLRGKSAVPDQKIEQYLIGKAISTRQRCGTSLEKRK
jgi:hypothetical protein